MKKSLFFSIIIILLSYQLAKAASTSTSNYKAQIIVASGSNLVNTTNYAVQTVIGEPILGITNTSNYNAWLGFFYGGYYFSNDPPATPTLTLPSSGSRQIGNSVTLNYTATDPNYDPLTYYVYGDTNTNPTTNIYTGSNKYYVWSTTDGQTYYWKVKAYDGNEWSGFSEIWNFTENTKPTHDSPVITPSNPQTLDNLTCTPQNGYDAEGDSITYIHNWEINSNSITVLNMPFDINASIKNRKVFDYSGYENNGTNHGAKWVSNGKVGGAYDFDGKGNYIEIPDSSLFNISKEITLMAWIYQKSLSGTYNKIISKRDHSNNFWFIATKAKGLYACVGNGNYQCTDAYPITNNEWHFVAFTFKNSEKIQRVYYDGVEVLAKSTTAQLVNFTAKVSIGADIQGTVGFFNGTIDEIKVFNRSLSAEQIYQLYLEGLNQLTTSKIVSNETTKGDTWLCEVTAIDGYEAGLTKSDSVTIGNTPPSNVMLIAPPNDTVTYNRTPFFNWTSAIDVDNDPITYHIMIATDPNFNNLAYNITGITNTNYIPSPVLNVDTTYWWRVRAYDGADYGEYSDTWNFTCESYRSINLSNTYIYLGSLKPGEVNDTTDNNPSPFIVENIGNIPTDIEIKANESLFVKAGLGERYFQAKADEYEANCYNPATTKTTWINLTDTFHGLISELEWNRSKNEAEIEIRVEVPQYEPGTTESEAKVTVYAT